MSNTYDNYYNKLALINVLLVVVAFVLMDFFFFDYSQVKDYSIAFYIKFGLVGLYSLGNDNLQAFDNEKKLNLRSTFDFSGALSCFWFAATDFFFLEGPPSFYVSAFVIIGMFGWFSFSAKLPFILKEKSGSEVFYISMLWANKIILLLMFVLFLLIIYNGSWEWKVLSPFSLFRL